MYFAVRRPTNVDSTGGVLSVSFGAHHAKDDGQLSSYDACSSEHRLRGSKLRHVTGRRAMQDDATLCLKPYQCLKSMGPRTARPPRFDQEGFSDVRIQSKSKEERSCLELVVFYGHAGHDSVCRHMRCRAIDSVAPEASTECWQRCTLDC